MSCRCEFWKSPIFPEPQTPLHPPKLLTEIKRSTENRSPGSKIRNFLRMESTSFSLNTSDPRVSSSPPKDFRLGERIEREGKACVIVVNKWDTVPEKDSNTTVQYELDVRERLRCLSWAPVVYSSALTLQRIPK